MRPRLPPLNALKAFEAAARHESFTRAAEELCVTQGAVSHQVKSLEAELAIKLFNRERQRLIITEAGRDYLTVVRDALDRIAIGTERLQQRQSAGVLTVTTSPDFAAKWLVHRLGHFAEAHASIDLRVSATMHHVDFAREDFDMAVRHGDGNRPGLDAVQLSGEQLFAKAIIGSPSARQAGGHPEVSANPPRQPIGLDKVAARCGYERREREARPSAQPCEHGDRRSDQRSGNRIGAHDASCLGPDQRPARAAFPGFATSLEDLLDRLSEGNGEPAEDRDFSRLALERSLSGSAASREAW
jgi:DNA-binding transcriptional LysR family regulator